MSTLPADTPGGGGGDADVVVTDRQLFDSAISDPAPQPEPQPQPEPSAPPEQPAEPQPQQQAQPGAQPRDAQGRFQQRPQQRPQQQQRPPQPGGGGPGQEHHVPLRTYLDEREQRYRIQAEHDQMRRAWAQLQEAQQQAMLAQQQAQMPRTIYDNPDMYLQHNVVQPLRQEGHMAMLSIKDGLSREFADAQYGAENVTNALNALASFRYTPNGDHIFRQIMASGHPYGALVKWFNAARAQQAIGPDPNAWVQKQRQAWLDDEQMQAEAVRRYQARMQPQQRQQQRPGGPPNVQLPPSLSSLPSSSGRADPAGDLSDASLWRAALR